MEGGKLENLKKNSWVRSENQQQTQGTLPGPGFKPWTVFLGCDYARVIMSGVKCDPDDGSHKTQACP